MKNACKITIKQVPASQVDRRADRRTRCSHWDYKHDNDNDNDDDDMDMDIAARLVQRQSFSQRSHSRSQTHVGVSLSLCVCVAASKRVLVCECLWEHKAKTNNSLYASVSWSWPAGSAICDPSCIFTLACTFDHCQHACFVRHVKWAAASKLRQQEASVRGSLLVTGQAKKPTAIAPRRNSYFRILSTMSSLPNCVQIMNTMKLQVSP